MNGQESRRFGYEKAALYAGVPAAILGGASWLFWGPERGTQVSTVIASLIAGPLFSIISAKSAEESFVMGKYGRAFAENIRSSLELALGTALTSAAVSRALGVPDDRVLFYSASSFLAGAGYVLWRTSAIFRIPPNNVNKDS